jgi:VWFA-related protein
VQHRIAISLSMLLALALGAVAAQDAADRSQDKKQGKKRVKATLVEPATPAPAPEPESAEPAERQAAPSEAEEPGEGPAEDPAEASANAPRATSTEQPAANGDAPAADAPSSAGGRREATAAAPAGATNADAAADTPAPALQERIEVIEVLLDVVVQDGDRPVTGLGPQDFVVEEEGRPVEVTSATFYGTPEQLAASGEGDVERADRYFIFLFHDRSRDASFVRPLLLDAGQQARRWVEQERLPNDQVAVAMWDVRLKIYSDFTRDPDQMLEAISRAVSARKEPDRGAGRSKEPLRPNADSPSLLLNLPAGPDLARDSRVFEKAVALLGRAAQGIVGRKNLMLFSIGFGEVGPAGVWLPDTRYYPDLEQSLNDGNVAVYSIDLVGGRRVAPAAPGISSSLSSIASDTEGLYFDTFTNFMTPMKEVAKDTTGYYLLSYRSEYDRGTSGYREVKVETRDRKHDVRARKGYRYGEPNQPLPEPPERDDEARPREPSTG